MGRLKRALYDQDIYGGRVAYLKLPSMKGKVSVFFSGKMISIGTKSEEDSVQDLNQVKGLLVEKGFVDDMTLKPRTRNMVAVADLGRPIDLESLSARQKLIYEPEQFPGGILRLKEPVKATILLFSSGKAVFAGLKSSGQIDIVLNDVLRRIS